jgi:capsule polysaccharide export protein KpsE/RkpR
MRDGVEKTDEIQALSLESSNGDRRYSYEREAFASRQRRLARLRIAWTGRRTILRWTIVGMIVSLAVAFIIPKRFESTTRLMPPEQANTTSGMAMLAAAATGTTGASIGSGALGSGLGSIAGDLLGLKSSGALFVGILRSETVEDDLIKKFSLQKVYRDAHIEDARIDLEAHTDAVEDRRSGIITIQVTDKSPERAAGMAREYVDQLNQVVTILNTSSAHRERVFLEQRLGEVQKDLVAAEHSFSEFASKNTAMDIPEQGKATIEAAAMLEGQYIAAQTELESLRPIYADGNVRVRAAKARVEELARQLDKIGGRFDSPDHPDANTDQSVQYPSLKRLPVLGVAYADLYRNAKLQEVVFATLTQQYETAKVQEAKETPTVKILDSAQVPGKKSFPPRIQILFLGTFLGFACALLWVFGNDAWQSTGADDPRKILATEVFSTLAARMPGISRNGFHKHPVHGVSEGLGSNGAGKALGG